MFRRPASRCVKLSLRLFPELAATCSNVLQPNTSGTWLRMVLIKSAVAKTFPCANEELISSQIRTRVSISTRPGVSPFKIEIRSGSTHCYLTEPKRAVTALMKRAKIDGVTLHDLRRSFGQALADSGENFPVIGAALGHQP